MISVRDQVSAWLAEQPDIAAELSYSERQLVKKGEHQKVVLDHIRKRRRQIKWARLNAGIMGGILLLAGLWSWAVEFGFVAFPADGDNALRGLGTLLVFGAIAIFGLFRVEASRRKVTLFDGAGEIDAFRGQVESVP